MTSEDTLLSKEEFKSKPVDFRIGAIISDGMWYTITKWRKMAMVSEEELQDWVEENLANGTLLQAESGAKSYRFPLESTRKWYSNNKLDPTKRLIPSVFPPRIWDNMTETEGFLDAPLREVGIVKISSPSTRALRAITEKLKGIARIRADQSGDYKAYGLDAIYIKSLVQEAVKDLPENEVVKIDSRVKSMRRELVDFTETFAGSLVQFYTTFGKSLVKSQMDTIKIFLPDQEDQNSQITLWVIMAIEKFDETAAVPFSGYLDTVLKRWPYDLPNIFLGKELSTFQRIQSRAIKKLREAHGENTARAFTPQEIADEMSISLQEYLELDEKHKTWMSTKNATTLTWQDTSEEKGQASDEEVITEVGSDPELANALSIATITAALDTEDYDSALLLISQIDAEDMNMEKLGDLPLAFVVALGKILNVAVKEDSDAVETEETEDIQDT